MAADKISVCIGEHNNDLPGVYIWLTPSMTQLLWIDVLEEGIRLRLDTPEMRFRVPDDLSIPRSEAVLREAAELVEQAGPFAQSVVALLEEINRTSPGRMGDRTDFDISHINVQPWVDGPWVDVVLGSMGGRLGSIMVEQTSS